MGKEMACEIWDFLGMTWRVDESDGRAVGAG
jgi:hypothetical protein